MSTGDVSDAGPGENCRFGAKLRGRVDVGEVWFEDFAEKASCVFKCRCVVSRETLEDDPAS